MVVVILLPIWLIYRWWGGSQNNVNGSTSEVLSSNSQILASTPINVNVPIPVLDAKGVSLGVMTMMVTDAEKRDEIIVQGKKANALEGRDFLIVNLKIINPIASGVGVKTRNYFRLNVNGSSDWLAPDIHNDKEDNGVEVQALSTKNTRIGFPINETDNSLILQIGPIEGEKQQVPLLF